MLVVLSEAIWLKILDNGNSIVATDMPKEYWFQDFDAVENHYAT